MKIGIIPNTEKDNILDVIREIIEKLSAHSIEFIISEKIKDIDNFSSLKLNSNILKPEIDVYSVSDLIISIGGDGTMLTTAFEAMEFQTPLIGLNMGKLGFLTEFDLENIDELILKLKNNEYSVEQRMVLEGNLPNKNRIFAINDIVIDKGKWPKMIEIKIWVDEKYVTTFSADGLIIATPTGSTGYSLSTGGPIVSPNSDVITLCPISPHTLTMRPLVLDSNKILKIKVKSPIEDIQINCDGQRTYYVNSGSELILRKSDKKVNLINTGFSDYFGVLRKKLHWGIDIRNNNGNGND